MKLSLYSSKIDNIQNKLNHGSATNNEISSLKNDLKDIKNLYNEEDKIFQKVKRSKEIRKTIKGISTISDQILGIARKSVNMKKQLNNNLIFSTKKNNLLSFDYSSNSSNSSNSSKSSKSYSKSKMSIKEENAIKRAVGIVNANYEGKKLEQNEENIKENKEHKYKLNFKNSVLKITKNLNKDELNTSPNRKATNNKNKKIDKEHNEILLTENKFSKNINQNNKFSEMIFNKRKDRIENKTLRLKNTNTKNEIKRENNRISSKFTFIYKTKENQNEFVNLNSLPNSKSKMKSKSKQLIDNKGSNSIVTNGEVILFNKDKTNIKLNNSKKRGKDKNKIDIIDSKRLSILEYFKQNPNNNKFANINSSFRLNFLKVLQKDKEEIKNENYSNTIHVEKADDFFGILNEVYKEKKLEEMKIKSLSRFFNLNSTKIPNNNLKQKDLKLNNQNSSVKSKLSTNNKHVQINDSFKIKSKIDTDKNKNENEEVKIDKKYKSFLANLNTVVKKNKSLNNDHILSLFGINKEILQKNSVQLLNNTNELNSFIIRDFKMSENNPIVNANKNLQISTNYFDKKKKEKIINNRNLVVEGGDNEINISDLSLISSKSKSNSKSSSKNTFVAKNYKSLKSYKSFKTHKTNKTNRTNRTNITKNTLNSNKSKDSIKNKNNKNKVEESVEFKFNSAKKNDNKLSLYNGNSNLLTVNSKNSKIISPSGGFNENKTNRLFSTIDTNTNYTKNVDTYREKNDSNIEKLDLNRRKESSRVIFDININRKKTESKFNRRSSECINNPNDINKRITKPNLEQSNNVKGMNNNIITTSDKIPGNESNSNKLKNLNFFKNFKKRLSPISKVKDDFKKIKDKEYEKIAKKSKVDCDIMNQLIEDISFEYDFENAENAILNNCKKNLDRLIQVLFIKKNKMSKVDLINKLENNKELKEKAFDKYDDVVKLLSKVGAPSFVKTRFKTSTLNKFNSIKGSYFGCKV